jgi:hypothetical protein
MTTANTVQITVRMRRIPATSAIAWIVRAKKNTCIPRGSVGKAPPLRPGFPRFHRP